MSTVELTVDGEVAWRFDHWMPVLWPWSFSADGITESRRLHTTLFEAGERFEVCRAGVAGDPYLAALVGVFVGLDATSLPRALGARPDAVLRLDIALFEQSRPYRFEERAARWQAFFAAAGSSPPDTAAALRQWERASLNPLRLFAEQQQDARSLAAQAQELGLDREQRGEALVRCLFGHPVSRPARALHHVWCHNAGGLPAIAHRARRPWWRRITG